MTSLRKALTVLHTTYNIPHVVISSLPLQQWLISALPHTTRSQIAPATADYLLCVSSSRTPQNNSLVHACAVPLFRGYFSGVGDLFSALVLAHFDPTQVYSSPATALSTATTFALTKTHSILSSTQAYALTLPSEDRTSTDDELDAHDQSRKIRRMKGRELRLVQGQEMLRHTSEDKLNPIRRMESWPTFWESQFIQ